MANVSEILEKFKPFQAQFNKQFSLVSQLAKEKLGGQSVDVTDLPKEYRLLEEKVDKIKAMHESFVKVSRTYTVPHNDYIPPVGDTVSDTFSNMQSSFMNVAASTQRAAGMQSVIPTSPTSSEIPKSLAHAFSKVAYYSSFTYNSEEPMAMALKKVAATQEKLGAFKLALDQDIAAKFHDPFIATLAGAIGDAMKSRRNVQAVRLTYDASRAHMKSAKPDYSAIAKSNMERNEDEFVAAVEQAMKMMKVVVASNESLKNLADLCAAQLTYFKSCHDAMAELSPEIDEFQVTQEAMSRHANI